MIRTYIARALFWAIHHQVRLAAWVDPTEGPAPRKQCICTSKEGWDPIRCLVDSGTGAAHCAVCRLELPDSAKVQKVRIKIGFTRPATSRAHPSEFNKPLN